MSLLYTQITTMAATIEEEILSVTVTYKDFSPLTFKQPSPVAKESKHAANTSTSKKAGSDKITTFALDVINPREKDSDGPKIHRINNFLETIVNLEHHLAQLKMFLSSPHLGNMKKKAEGLLDTILQLMEMVDLLHNCQSKVCLPNIELLKSFTVLIFYSGTNYLIFLTMLLQQLEVQVA